MSRLHYSAPCSWLDPAKHLPFFKIDFLQPIKLLIRSDFTIIDIFTPVGIAITTGATQHLTLVVKQTQASEIWISSEVEHFDSPDHRSLRDPGVGPFLAVAGQIFGVEMSRVAIGEDELQR